MGALAVKTPVAQQVPRLDDQRVPFPPSDGITGVGAVVLRNVLRPQAHDPGPVHPLDQDDDVGVGLDDRLQVVVRPRPDRHRRALVEHAAVAQREGLGPVVRVVAVLEPPGRAGVLVAERRQGVEARLSGFGSGRETPVRRIGEHGSPVPPVDLKGGRAAVEPEEVVAADAPETLIGQPGDHAAVRFPDLQVAGVGSRRSVGDRLRFLFGQVHPVTEPRIALQRRERRNVVVAGEIRLAARRARDLICDEERRDEQGHRRTQGEDSGLHSRPPDTHCSWTHRA